MSAKNVNRIQKLYLIFHQKVEKEKQENPRSQREKQKQEKLVQKNRGVECTGIDHDQKII